MLYDTNRLFYSSVGRIGVKRGATVGIPIALIQSTVSKDAYFIEHMQAASYISKVECKEGWIGFLCTWIILKDGWSAIERCKVYTIWALDDLCNIAVQCRWMHSSL